MGKITTAVRIENAVDWVRAESDSDAPARSATALAHVDTGSVERCAPTFVARDERGPFLSAKPSGTASGKCPESNDAEQSEAEQSEAVVLLAQAFDLTDRPARLPGAQTPSLADVRRFLIERLEHLLEGNPALLMSALYRVDVRERGVQRVLAESPPGHLPADLADLLIERQLEKVQMRRRYRERSDR